MNLIKKILTVGIAVSMIFPFSAISSYAKGKDGPGPVKPLDEKEIGKGFDEEDDWKIVGASRNEDKDATKFILSSEKATLTKHFKDFPVWDYSDLYVSVKEVSEGAKWKLSVKGDHSSAKEMIIQKDSSNANSTFNESFVYSLEGLAGSEANSNWNREGDKSFTMTFTFTGKTGDVVSLGDLVSAKPNYEIPKALPSNIKGKVGNLNFDGDLNLDVDTLKNDDLGDSFSTSLKEHQWLSLPYSRMVVHPEYYFDNGKITPVSEDLDLEFGVYYGINGNANATLGAAEGKSGFQPSSYNAILKVAGQSIEKKSVTSAWYPHKLTRGADFAGKGHIELVDFMVDKNTIGRIIDTSQLTDDLEIVVKDGAKFGSARHVTNLKSSWNEENNVVLKTDNQKVATDLFNQSIKVVALNQDGSINKELTNTITTPMFEDGQGKYIIPATIEKVGLVIGYSNHEEGQQKCIDRVNEAINSNLVKGYENTKDYWNETLRKVPVPDTWGIEDINIKGYDTVSQEEHRVLYYSGWVHNLTNTLSPTPETGYAHTLQALGKPSRQVAGSSMSPANNCWEGVLQIQNIMYVDSSAAWSGMEGFMSMVDANGYLDGEVLPVRMAQTLWMIHEISPDNARMKALYPALKRHLQYKISDPRWIYGNTASQNEIDQEYVTSWMNDVIYIKKICEELGGEYSKDIEYWNSEYNRVMKNYADWFFCDPMSHEAKGSYPTDGSPDQPMRNGAGLPSAQHQRGLWTRIFHIDGDVNAIKDTCNNEDGPNYAHSSQGGHIVSPPPGRYPREWVQVILAGLVLQDIPLDQTKQLEQFFLDINNPALSISGLENLKWAPASFLIYGLVNRGFYDEAKNQLDSYLVKSVDVWQFCENYKYNSSGPYGTHATSFGASQIIELTMVKNGVINDGSGVRAIKNWNEGMNKAENPEITISLQTPPDEITAASKLPNEITQVYHRKGFKKEEYSLNKVTSVVWNAEKMKKTSDPNIYEFYGETETHAEVKATVVFNVGKETLKNLIDDSTDIVSKASIGDGNGQYPQSAVDAINKIISQGNDILNKEDATIEEIGKNILDLSNGIEDFKKSKIVVNIENLTKKIEEAEKLLDNSEIGDKDGQYPLESKDMLNKEIETAKSIIDNDTYTDKEIEEVSKSLDSAIESFKQSKIVVDKRELQELINKCKDVLDKAEVGDKNGQYSQIAIDKFEKVLETASKILSHEKLTQKEIDDEIKKLEKALNEFKQSINKEGGVVEIPDNDANGSNAESSNGAVVTSDNVSFNTPLVLMSLSIIGIGFILKKKSISR